MAQKQMNKRELAPFNSIFKKSGEDGVGGVYFDTMETRVVSKPTNIVDSSIVEMKTDTVVETESKHIVSDINGVKFYKQLEMLYNIYKPGDITIAMDLSEKGSKCYALFPNTLSVQTFVMSLPKSKRYFYEVCLYSTKHSIRNVAVKLFFDIDFKDENKNGKLVTDEFLNLLINAIFTNVCDVLQRYYMLEYEIADLVVIDSGDHIDFQSDMFKYKENGLSRIELTKEERDELIETTTIGKKSSFHLVFN